MAAGYFLPESRSQACRSVPHPLAPQTLRQREMACYQRFFQFEGVAEAWLKRDNWALFREILRGNGDIDRLHLRSFTTRCAKGVAELVPCKPRPRICRNLLPSCLLQLHETMFADLLQSLSDPHRAKRGIAEARRIRLSSSYAECEIGPAIA